MTTSTPIAGLILAAGKGTRMKSELPKCLHEVCGVPMVKLVAMALEQAGVGRIVIVVGHGGGLLREALGEGYEYAEQTEQLGTGHAVMAAASHFEGFEGSIVVACGDTPLLHPSTVIELIQKRNSHQADATLSYCELEDASGYGRIVLEQDQVVAIVEDKEATPEQRRIRTMNPALYCFDSAKLFRLLPDLSNANETGEYYLTDMIAAIRAEGGTVIGDLAPDFKQFLGVNDRWQLAEASQIMRSRVLKKHAWNGVTIVDPNSTYIGVEVQIAPDVVIEPMTVIDGLTTIGTGSRIGPNSWIKDSLIGRNVRIFMSHLDQAQMDEGSRCGPFANLRPMSHLGEKVKVGNFVEIKNAEIGAQTSISHLTYIGDASVGERTNIGAGTITCNYDGFTKSKTEIGDDVFVGSNSTLVAPVNIGDGAMTAAGSTINKDVPPGALGIGRGKQENKEEWAKQWRDRKKQARGTGTGKA
jgi:bifunctional UDP-N-acetylglucosamine pyrophosphorylase/glucosamine-1-phosphate N-acetyltransferase